MAPQVWAWRPGRLRSLRGAFDRLAVLFPFEEPLWRGAGHDAVYVGHPAWTPGPLTTGERHVVAVLPGSRAGEVRRLAEPLCRAAARLLDAGHAAQGRVILAPGLPPSSTGPARELAERLGLEVAEVDTRLGIGPLLADVSVALCASGTASLEAALAGAAPVIAYRMDLVSFALARRLVRTPYVGLPNVLLGARAFPELLQGEVTAERVERAARGLIDGAHARDRTASASLRLRELLRPPSSESFGERVAALVSPWLAGTRVR